MLGVGAGAALSPRLANALTPDEVEGGIERGFGASSDDEISVDVDGSTVTINGFEHKMPNTEGYAGSRFNRYLKKNVRSDIDWIDFCEQKTTLSDSGRPLFLRNFNFNWDGAVYRSDIRPRWLFRALGEIFVFNHADVFEDTSGKKILLAYYSNNMPAGIFLFNMKILIKVLYKCKEIEKEMSKRKGRKFTMIRDISKNSLLRDLNQMYINVKQNKSLDELLRLKDR